MNKLPLRLRLPLYAATIVGFSLSAFAYLDLAADRYHLTSKLDSTMTEETQWVADYLNNHSLESTVAHMKEIFSQIGHLHDFQITTSEGSALFQTCRVADINMPPLPGARSKLARSFKDTTGYFRIVDTPIKTSSNQEAWLRTLGSMKDIEEHIFFLRMYNLVAVPIISLLAAIGGLTIFRVLLRPISELAESAKRISKGDGIIRLDDTCEVDEILYLTKVLNAAFSEIQNDSRKMSQFTADAAHELRSPVAAIRLLSESALSICDSHEHATRALKSIHLESVHMSELITQLLTITRLESEQKVYSDDVVRVDYVLHNLFEAFESRARERQIFLVLEETIEWEVPGDRVLLRQMFANLIENAIKYTPAGGRVTVSSRVVGQTCSVTVTDTGVGISAQHLEKIFDRFYRVDASRNVNSGGNGLGLAICRAIVHSMRGSITAKSDPGFGTSVIATLPGRVAVELTESAA